MKDDFFDIVVIGGGITGAGILRDAALRGYKAVLIEKDDYASGTSSKSSKLVHGGFRYLKNLEFGLVHEALMERKTLMEIAPHLVHPIECLLPVYKKSSTPGWLIQLGMLLYDGLSFTKRIGTHKLLPIEDLENTEPELRKEGLQKLFMYYDSRADDSRLVMANIQSAAEHGALAANYIKAIDVVQHEDHVLGVKVQDQVTGDEFVIRTKVTANATGPWCDELRNKLFGDGNRRIRTTKGIHLLVKRSDLQIERTMILTTVQDDRPVFAVPWREYVILGTTDTDFDGQADWVGIGSDDVDYLLKTYNYYFPRANLTKDKVLSVWAGLRPLTFEEGKAAGEVTREYQIFEAPKNFFTIIGGKLTTYRTMGEELVDRLADVLQDKFAINAVNAKCRTDKIALFGGDIENYNEFSAMWTERLVGKYKFEKDITLNLIESYGSRINEVISAIADAKNGRERIIPNLPYVWGELYYAMQYEMAVNLDDFLLRRTHLFSLDEKHALDIHIRIAEIMADELGWDNSEKQKQIDNYNKKIEMITAFRKN